MKKPPQEMIKDFLEWYDSDQHSEKEDVYSDEINENNIRGMSREDLIEFFFQFARSGGNVQSGGYRTAPGFKRTMEENYSEFRDFILEPFAHNFKLDSWLNRIGEYPYFGKGLATIYLNRIDNSQFAIINNKSVEAIKLFDVDVPANLVDRYKTVCEAWSQIIDWYPEINNFYRADSIAQYLIGEESGKPWADKLQKPKVDNVKRYWIYAPGPNAQYWDEYFQDGVMGLGWFEMDVDLSSFKTVEDLRKHYHDVFGSDASDVVFKQLTDFSCEMSVGDTIFVKKGIKLLVGYGEVTSDYYYDKESKYEYKDLRKVKWHTSGEWKIPEDWTGLPVKTLTELTDEERVGKYLKLMGVEMKQGYFTEKTFSLLEGLHKNPTRDFYNEHKDAFKEDVMDPFRLLMSRVADALCPEVKDLLETESKLFSRIPKNDYGRGGAWDHYWAAFYPKGKKRIESPQLFMGISKNYLDFGFYIGEYGSKYLTKFVKNSKNNCESILNMLSDIIDDGSIIFSENDRTEEDWHSSTGSVISMQEWLEDIEHYNSRAAASLTKVQVLSSVDLVDDIAKAFNKLFVFILLATEDEPLKAIQQYLGTEDEEELNPLYTLTQCARETFFDVSLLNRWVSAIERKKHAIFYGPPGTGKTFVSEKIAKHLISEGDGFFEVVQFHPSYAYEDFIQGLRPKKLTDGGLEYAMVPGRFKDFCRRARLCKNKCVLIIDEINRANLSRVLGELMYLLEYRERAIPLAGGEMFQIPSNVRIIGTMNTADRSIALVDHALRRRFAFLGLYPNYEILRRFHVDSEFEPNGLIGVLKRLNVAIGDKHYSVGISYFLREHIIDEIEEIWMSEIEPYIEELFFDQPDKAESFSWDRIKSEIGFE